MAQGYELPFELGQEREQLAQRQALIDAIQAQSLQPRQGQMVSGHYVGQGLPGAAMQIAQALIAKSGQNRLAGQRADLGRRFTEANQGAVQQYLLDRAQDPRAAAARAMSSGLPALAALGQQDIKDLAPKTMAVGGQVVRVEGDQAKPLGDFGEKYGGLETLGVDQQGNPILGQRSQTGGKNAYVPRGGVTVNTGSNPVDRAVAPTVIKDIQAARNAIVDAGKANDLADRFATLVSDPKVITGAFAEPRAFLANMANTLFPGDEASLAKTQQAIKASAELALQQSRTTQGQGAVSDYERSLFQKASGGDLNFTPTALRDLMLGIKKTAALSRAQSQQFLNQVGQNPLYKPYVDMYAAPPPQGASDVAPLTPLPEAGTPPQQPSTATKFIFNPETGKLEPKP